MWTKHFSRNLRGTRIWRLLLGLGIGLALVFGSTYTASAILSELGDLRRVDEVHDALLVHEDQFDIRQEAFLEVFEIGDVFFDTSFNALDGGGANVGNGERFTRIPRADLRGVGQWFNHQPPRPTGPNAAVCTDCHREPGDGAGPAGSNVHRDPLRTGNISQFIQRNTPHLFGPGAVQVLAEEMTEELHAIRNAARQAACTSTNGFAQRDLIAKGVRFGAIRANRTATNPCQVSFDTSSVVGVASDLIVRPFQWKGANTTVRDFSRGATNNELGVTPNELVADGNVDQDGDGVVNEATVGDITALAVYLAAQPRPTSLQELASLGLIDPASFDSAAVDRGRQVFTQLRCDFCHTPQLLINDPVFHEPSQNPNFRDATFPGGGNPIAAGLDPAHPNSFNLTTDLPDNPVMTPGGTTLGNFRRDAQGRAIVELFSDLKRHNMGPGLNEAVDEVGTGAGTFLTETLWGVGSTAPYLHDGRATTLAEAILEHDGPAEGTPNSIGGRDAANAFNNATPQQRADLIAFLENLVLFFME